MKAKTNSVAVDASGRIAAAIRGAMMQAGDRGRFWRYYDDRIARIHLAATCASQARVAFNHELNSYLATPVSEADLAPWSFFPPALAAGVKKIVKIDALSTGGRSALLLPESAVKLGLPPCLYLNLEPLGWGTGNLELHFEVKGAGTLFERTKVDLTVLERILSERPDLARSIQSARMDGARPMMFSSLAMYESRNLGGQREDYAVHSVNASQAALGTSSIRFVPTLYAVVLPERYHENLRFISRACPSTEALYNARLANEVRCTPSTVRAVYFDRAGSDEMIAQLCRRVAPRIDELEETSLGLADDVRRYFEHIAKSTQLRMDPRHVLDRCVFTWMQFGDIWVTFERDEDGDYRYAREYRYDRTVAWYLAKDEVIIRKLGRMFVDIECLRSIQVALNEEELEFQHALFVLNVLRDHNRVATQFRIGSVLVDANFVSYEDRKALHQRVLHDMMHAVNQSNWVRMDINDKVVEVDITYEHVEGLKKRYIVPRKQMCEIYV
jgi:hypothetical protein